MQAGIMSSASINIIRSNPIISADLSGLSVIRSFIIRMNPVYDKMDGGLNGFHRSTSLDISEIFISSWYAKQNNLLPSINHLNQPTLRLKDGTKIMIV